MDPLHPFQPELCCIKKAHANLIVPVGFVITRAVLGS